MTAELKLHLRMLSDWHIGTGTAAHGHIDRRVQRDSYGLPFVPAKTLIGVWRDACEVAANALDSGYTGDWHCWLEYLFGSQPSHAAKETGRRPDSSTRHPRPAALVLRGPLHFPGRLGPVLAARPRLREAVTFVKPGVAIDPATGTALEGMLRYEEMARGGMTLEGTAELSGSLTESQRRCALALLWAGAVLVEGIGGKRRRGAGRCRLEPSGPGMPPASEDLEAVLSQPPAAPPAPADRGPVLGAETSPSKESWERAELTFELLTPLLAHDRTIGNLVSGRDHIPGWLMLRSVLSLLGEGAAAAARRGDLVVTSATPLVDGRPGRPAPRVLAAAKDDQDQIINWMVQQPGDEDATFKRLRSGYVSAEPGGVLAVHRPVFVTRMHNTVQDETQRPDESLGGVYVYRALEPGTMLAAEVRVRTGVLTEGWHDRLTETWRLGRSRKDDYGLAKVTARLRPDGPARPGAVPSLRKGDRLRVWLLSDVLVRDRRLAPSADPADFARALCDAFARAGEIDVTLGPVMEDAGLVPTSYEMSRTDSWQVGWGLPRPSLLGLAAGGCLTFEVTEGGIGPDALAAVELGGMGERRGEGFGQVRFNDPLLAGPVTSSGASVTGRPKVTDPGDLLPGEDGHVEARLIERAAWRAEIWRRAEQHASGVDQILGPLTELSASRLNSVRGLLNRLGEDSETLRQRIARLTARWPKSEAVRDALEKLLTTEDRLWVLLALPTAELCLTSDGPRVLPTELRREALRTLITACLAASTRRAAHEGQGATA
ncbi:RAMP superfamily CRISPR-associated protein [Actinomadura napierensis]|uniref:CRISPR type III-associated protein domain-containing protein n=1 Tax=Actinomadura napierensis TaxID=267854 RepID=A0ABN3ADG0_9ACTN